MKENNVYYMQLAYKKAQIAFLNNNVPVGCVIANKKNTLICSNNTNSKDKIPFEHAEFKCLRSLNTNNRKFNKYFVFTTLLPCPMCAGAFFVNGIKRQYYGAKSNDSKYNSYYFELFDKKTTYSYLSLRCSEILSMFFKVRR